MDYNGLNEILQAISDNDSFIILTHDKPDGDAVGSSTALALFLNNLGKKCTVISPSAIPQRLEFAKNNAVNYMVGSESIDIPEDSAVISVDVASRELLSDLNNVINEKIDIIIDHHKVNTISGGYKYVDSNASAAGEIIYELISMYEMVMCTNIIDKDIAEALFTSISSDTGCFKYGNTTANTHKIASELLNVGINSEEINRLLFDTKSVLQIKTEQLAYQKLKMYYDGKLAMIDIDKSDLDSIGATEEDTETISQLARMISGVQIGVMMREKEFAGEKTGYKFSVRANSDTDVSLLCAAFNGGGHKKAAGCTIFEAKDDALKLFLEEAEKYII